MSQDYLLIYEENVIKTSDLTLYNWNFYGPYTFYQHD